MDKVMFWLQVVIVAIAGIYIFKLIASQSNVGGLQEFAKAI